MTARSRRRIGWWAFAVAIVVVAALTERWFVNPTVDEPGRADAVFVLAGGGDRMVYGLDLVRDGVASEIVFASGFIETEQRWAVPACNGAAPADLPAEITIRCVEPRPATTRGEARLLSELAEQEGWESVVAVASTDQITRARLLIGRCWDGHLRMTGPAHDEPWPVRAIYEWGAGVKAAIVRDC